MILDKRQPYEITVRVPMFASGPHFPKGASTDAVVLNIDIAPTAVDVAMRSGAKETVPTEFSLPFDGVSLVTQLAPGKDRSSFLIEYHGMGNGVDSNDSCSHINMRYSISSIYRAPIYRAPIYRSPIYRATIYRVPRFTCMIHSHC